MPPPPTILLGEDGRPKRRRVTAVTVFTRDLRNKRPDLRTLPMSNMKLINAANEAFDQLTVEEQWRYEQLAKAENRNYDEMYSDQFRRDCEGAYISERDTLANQQREFELYTSKIVANLAGSVTDRDELTESEFVVGDVTAFVDADERDQGLYVPAEFGFVRFSLTEGVVASLHCIVQPREKAIPAHLYSHCRDRIEDTHGIPMHSCPDADENTVRLCIELKSLCSKSGDAQTRWQLPIFVPSERLVAMQKALIYAYNDPIVCKEGCPFVKEISRSNQTKVFPFESLCLAVLASKCLPEDKRQTGLLASQITQLLNTRRYTGEEHACQLHRREDNMLSCALMLAHSHAWTLLERAVQPFGLVWTPKHGPKDLDVPVPQPKKVGWISRANNNNYGGSGGGGGGGGFNRRNASCPTNLASSGGAVRPVAKQRQPPRPAPPAPPAAAAAAAVACYSPTFTDYPDEEDLDREFRRVVSVEPTPAAPDAFRQDSGYYDDHPVGGAIGLGRGRGRGRSRPGKPIMLD